MTKEEEILMSSDDEEDTPVTRQKTNTYNSQDKLERLIDSLLTTFETRILDLTESKFSQYVFLFLCSIEKTFRQKLLTLLIIKSYSNKIHVSLRMHYVNFFCSFLARQDGWVATDTVLKSLVIF